MNGKKAIPRSVVAVIVLIVASFLLIFIEGLSSTLISLYQLLSYTAPPAISHYDESLGWTGSPDLYIPDMYGQGKYVHTNSRGFRNADNVEVTMDDSRIRIICSGDSFTYGEGVANNQAWCNRMSGLDDRLETVNLALPGYGIDQIYLRYLRDGAVLERTIHLFAFIVGDFTRMGYLDHHQYGKPVLRLEQGTLVADNVPVPRHRWSAGRSITRADFRIVDLAKRVITRLKSTSEGSRGLLERVGPVASHIFQATHQLDVEHDVVPVFVFLPTERDLEDDHVWHQWTVNTMEELGLHFIDLTPAMRDLPAGEVEGFFIAPGKQAEGHYTEAGNKWVSETVYERIRKVPHIRTLFSAHGQPTVTGQADPTRRM